MADWQSVLDIKAEWKQVAEETMTPAELCKAVSDKLQILGPFDNQDVNRLQKKLVEKFTEASKNAELTYDEFDDLLEYLYDWGYTCLDSDKVMGKKVCWIKTMF